MKTLLAWAKANLIIVILVFVTILALPSLLFLSARKSSKLRSDVQTQIDADWRAIQSISVGYRVPSLDPKKPSIEFNRPPNAATTEVLRDRIEKLHAQGDAIMKVAIEHNRKDRVVGPDASDAQKADDPFYGLFPEPDPSQETKLRQEVSAKWVGAHERLIQKHGGGKPRDPESVLQSLQAERSHLIAQSGEPSTDQDRRELAEALSNARLALYRSRAAELRFYAEPSVFVGVAPWPQQGELPKLPTIWDWRHRYWIAQDLIAAIDLANTDPAIGAPLFIPDAPVKRIESITIRPWNLEGGEPAEATLSADLSAEIPPHYDASPTGRAGFPIAPNPLYFVRYADVNLLVASSRIPQILNAINAENFMAVVDLDISSVDASADLPQGYYYGADHIVRLHLVIETIWLRSWMEPLMPAGAKKALGIAPPGEPGQPAGKAPPRGRGSREEEER